MRFMADFQEKHTLFTNNSYTAGILCSKSDVFSGNCIIPGLESSYKCEIMDGQGLWGHKFSNISLDFRAA